MGGHRQRRPQLEKAARERSMPVRADLQKLAADFLALKSAEELCLLLEASIEDVLAVYSPEYSNFAVVRKGKNRTVLSPGVKLASVLRKLLKYLDAVYVSHVSEENSSANAFITATRPAGPFSPSVGQSPERNIVCNARPHVGKGLVVRIDIEDFFPSIKEAHVRTLFQNAPFAFPQALVSLLCQAVLYEGALPVGSPTSPVLSNFILKELDQEFRDIPYISYTRYADDFTFSTDHYSAVGIQPVVNSVIRSIEKHGFRVNKRKIAVASANQRQEVTGIIVNTKLNVRRTYIREIRAILHSIETTGWELAARRYVQKHPTKYRSSLQRYFYTVHQLKLSDEVMRTYCHSGEIWYLYKSLRGKIGHVGYVKGKTDEIYNKLKIQFLKLKKEHSVVAGTNRVAADKISPEIDKSDELAYITNATAKTVVYYAYMFLKHCGYTDFRVAALRSELSIDSKAGLKGMLRSFEKESAYFINLYLYMREENRFAEFTNSLSVDVFKRLFKFNENAESLNLYFDRRIFHVAPKCNAARKDYDDGIKYEANTGIFLDGVDDSKGTYIIRRTFLQQLGMRACLRCDS